VNYGPIEKPHRRSGVSCGPPDLRRAGDVKTLDDYGAVVLDGVYVLRWRAACRAASRERPELAPSREQAAGSVVPPRGQRSGPSRIGGLSIDRRVELDRGDDAVSAGGLRAPGAPHTAQADRHRRTIQQVAPPAFALGETDVDDHPIAIRRYPTGKQHAIRAAAGHTDQCKAPAQHRMKR